MAADPTPAPGSRVGRYELLKQIATSAMGSTWIARSTDPDKRRVAVGVMQKSLTSFSVAEAVLREARLAQKLRNENVLDVVETVVGDGQLSVVSAYVDGAWLSELLSEPLAGPVALRVALDVIAAVAAAHAQTPALSHGDLNPSHVRVGLDGIGRVASFGVARAVTGIVPAEERAKSLPYLAPERLDVDASGKVTLSTRGTMEAGARKASDVYAAAAIAWHALSGKAPFGGDSDKQTAESVRDGAPAEPDDAGDLEAVFDVLRKALAKAKQERPSIEELQKQLKAAADASGGAANREAVGAALTARGVEPQQVEEPPPQPAKSAAPPATKSVEPKAEEKKPDSEKKPEEKKPEPAKAPLRKGTLIGMQAPLAASKPLPEPPKPKSPEPPKAESKPEDKKEAKTPAPPVKPPMPRPGMKKTLVGMVAPPPPPEKPRAPIESLQDFDAEEEKAEKVDVDVDEADEPKDESAGAVAPWDEPGDAAEAKVDEKKDEAEAAPKTDEKKEADAPAKGDEPKADVAASPKPAAAAAEKKQDMEDIFAADAAAPESPLPAEVPAPIGADDDDLAAMRPKKKTGLIVGGVVVAGIAVIGLLAITGGGGDKKDASASATPTASQAKPPGPAKTADQPAAPPTATDVPAQEPPKPEATTPAPPETSTPEPPAKPTAIAVAKGPLAPPQRAVAQPPKPPPVAKPALTAKPVGTIKKPPPKKANPNTL